MGTFRVDQVLRAGDTFDILKQFRTEGIKMLFLRKDKSHIEVGTIKNLVPTKTDVKGYISFNPGKFVKHMKGRETKGFLFTMIDGKWCVTKDMDDSVLTISQLLIMERKYSSR